MTYLQEAIIMTVVKVKLTWCVGIDTEALVMDRHLVSFRTCCLFELEKGKWREEFLSKPKLGPSTKFKVKCGEAEECRQTLRLQFLS